MIAAAAVLFAACGPRTAPARTAAPAPAPAQADVAGTSAPSPQPAPTTAPTTATTTATTAPAATPATSPTPPPTSSLDRLPGEPAVGVQVHATWESYTAADRIAILDKLAAAGAEWVRIDVGWASYESQGTGQIDAWYADRVSATVDAARARGLQVLLTPWTTPAWANAGAGVRNPPTDPADYARFVAWLAESLRGKVAAYEIWNEPNLEDFWAGSTAQYVELLRAAYPAVKAGDPGAQVVVGGPAYNDTAWISALYQGGAQGSFDVMATHPYQGLANLPPETPDDGTQYTLAHVAAVRDLMVANGDGDLPIWFTEFGWSNHANEPGTPNWRLGVTDAQQGEYLIRSLRWLATNAPYVTQVFWYNDRNQTSGNVQLDNYGLLTRDLQEKPAYLALRDYLR